MTALPTPHGLGTKGGAACDPFLPLLPALPPSDDFYVLSSGLVTLETTIDNNNQTLAEEYASEQARMRSDGGGESWGAGVAGVGRAY